MKFLVGNKSDNKEMRKVSFEEGLNLAKFFNLEFIECSAKTNDNIESIFPTLLKQIIYQFENVNLNTNEG